MRQALFCLFVAAAGLCASCDMPVRFVGDPVCGENAEENATVDVSGIARVDDGYEVDIPLREDGVTGFHLNREWLFTIVSDVPPEGSMRVVLKSVKTETGCRRTAVFHVRRLSDIK